MKSEIKLCFVTIKGYILLTSYYAVAFLTYQEADFESIVKKIHITTERFAQQEDRDSSQLVNVHTSMQGRDVTLRTQAPF